MADEQHQSPKKLQPKSIWKELSYLEWAAILIVIGYFFYLNQSTALVLNYNNETKQVLYKPNDLVPKSNVSNSQTFFGIILYIICVGILLSKRIRSPRRATMKEALDDLSKQLKELKNLPLEDGTSIPIRDNIKVEPTPYFITRYRETAEEARAFRYTFMVIVKSLDDELSYYYKAWYHPWDRYWDAFLPTKTPLSDKDKCPNCGTEYDVRIINTTDVQKAMTIRRGFQAK